MESRTGPSVPFSPVTPDRPSVQPLLSSAAIADSKYLVAPRTYEVAPYVSPVPDFDFNLRSLRGNAVLLFEARPDDIFLLKVN